MFPCSTFILLQSEEVTTPCNTVLLTSCFSNSFSFCFFSSLPSTGKQDS